LILKISATKPALKSTERVQFHTYSLKNGVVMHALVEGMAPSLGKVVMGNIARLELGEHKIAKELTELGLSKVARSGQYAEGMMTKLNEPDILWNVETLTIIDSHQEI
jgi:hypothetical protein